MRESCHQGPAIAIASEVLRATAACIRIKFAGEKWGALKDLSSTAWKSVGVLER